MKITDFLIKSANSVYEDDFRSFLVNSGFMQKIMTDGYSNIDQQEEYLDFYPQWILSSKNNKFLGLESYPYKNISLGCTQSLDEFHYYCANQGKKIRMYRGEYPYNRDCVDFDWEKSFIDDHPLEKGDAVIISAPFSGTGSLHSYWQETLDRCLELSIPVLVDCAFFGTCSGVNIDLSHPAIEKVVFSTTKGLSCGNYRSGIEFSRREKSHLRIQTEWHHGIHLNTSMGLALMKQFSPDYVHDKYSSIYKKVCSELSLTETNCIHLALGNEKWSEYSRDGVCNRIGVKNLIRDIYRCEKKNKVFDFNSIPGIQDKL